MFKPAAQSRPRRSQFYSYPAPVSGWISNRALSTPATGQAGQGAEVLDNFFPTATAAIMRRGSVRYAQAGLDGEGAVRSIFSYKNGEAQRMFVATDSAIYDATVILTTINYQFADENDDVFVDENGDSFGQSSTSDNATLTGTTNGQWRVVQFATDGGVFLRGVNGQDTPFVFDGTDMTTTPAITLDDMLPASTLNHVWSHKGRLWFIRRESLDAYYLPVNQIGGEATRFPMAGIFPRGGSLLFGQSWSIEAGDGLAQHCVMVTTEGEVAVYRGVDPSSATDWQLVGVYRLGKPLGKEAFIRAGGDLVIATDIGFIPLSQAIQRDYAALSPSAVSYPIEVAWNDAVEARPGEWRCEVWPTNQMVLVVPTQVPDQQSEIYVANTRTGSWGRYTGWDATCLEVFRDRLFFGTADGFVVEANVSGADRGQPYTGRYVPLFYDVKSPGSRKISELSRPVIRSPYGVDEQISMQFDFEVDFPPDPDVTARALGNTWGGAIWGQSLWGEDSAAKIQQAWRSTGGSGYAMAPALQVTSGSTTPLDAEVVRIDVTFSIGDIVS